MGRAVPAVSVPGRPEDAQPGQFWRAVYDKVPPPPPHHFRGKDKITIHEDTDGDGNFDKHKTFVDGLNIATSLVTGPRRRLGAQSAVPALLSRPQQRRRARRRPRRSTWKASAWRTRIRCVNSLRWGPDGWLYAAQGSTVTGNVKRRRASTATRAAVHSMGQLIWRYHPETNRYEIFAEGGGNAFGVEIDAKGRIYSGHNGGDTRGFHYVQGGYYRRASTSTGRSPIPTPSATSRP